MKRTALYGLAMALLAWATPAFGQPVNLPANTVWGRLGIGAGPGQAIPFANLASSLGISVGTEVITGGTSSATSYGVLFNKNGIVGDTNKDTSLATGIVGVPITISSNTAVLPCISGSLSGAGCGGALPILQLATADEGETILGLRSFGTNSNSTISCGKARGTAANPLPLQSGDIICVLAANGWQASGVLGGAVGTGFIEFRAAENWSASATGTTLHVSLQKAGTVYPVVDQTVLDIGGSGGMYLANNIGGDVGYGSINMPGPLLVNSNAAAMNSGPAGTSVHTAKADGVENTMLYDAFASDVAVVLRRGNNTQASPSALAANDLIGGVFAQGMGSTTFSSSRAGLTFFANQIWTDANQGTYADISTTANGSTTRTTRVRVENDGGVTFPNTVTGGSCGSGCINATAIRVANNAVIASGTTAGGDLTGTYPNPTITNITSGATMPGFIDGTAIAAPANPSAGKIRTYFDSVQGNLVAKLSSGALSTTVIPDTGAANNFLTAIGPGGVITKAQPSFANLSGTPTTLSGYGITSPLPFAQGGTADTGTACTSFTPSVTITGGTGTNSTGSTGCYKQLAAKVFWVSFSLVINYSTIPTSFTVTLPNSFAAQTAVVIVGQNTTTGNLLQARVNATATASGNIVDTTGAIGITGSGQTVILSGAIGNS